MPLKQSIAQAIVRLSLACFEAPGKTVAVSAGSFLAGLILTACCLDLRMDWTYLFAPNDPVVSEFKEAREVFPYPGDIVVLVDGESAQIREQFLERLSNRLNEEPEVFFHVYYKFDLSALKCKALYFLSEDQLLALKNGLASLNSKGASPPPPLGELGRKLLLELSVELGRSLESRGRAPHRPLWEGLPSNEWLGYVSAVLGGENELYTTLAGGKIHVLVLKSGTRGTGLEQKPDTVPRLRRVLKELSPETLGLRVRLTGLPVLLHDERETCSRDSLRSAGLSLLLVIIVFGLGFGEARRPLMAVTALVCGLGWTLAYTTLAVGHLNFITVGMVTMLLGLGIDFGIHILFRYQEELLKCSDPKQALAQTMSGTGVDIFVGALATAVAFLSLAFAGFRGIADLGVIASGGVLLCFLSSVTVLPALLALHDRPRTTSAEGSALASLEDSWLSRASAVSVAGIVLVLGALFFAAKVGFNSNLLDVQAPGLESVRTEREMIQRLRRTVLSAATIVDSAQEARELRELLEPLKSVETVTSVADLIPEASTTQRALVNEITILAERVHLPPPIPVESAQDLLALRSKLLGMKGRLAATPDDPELKAAVEKLKAQLAAMDPGPIQDGLSTFQDSMRKDIESLVQLLKAQEKEPPTASDIPEEIRLRFLSPEGLYLVTVSPSKNIWEPRHLRTFLDDVTRIRPELVGHPVIQNHILTSFQKAYKLTPWFTLGAVLLVMWLYLRDMRAVLLALLPTALGITGIFGVMGLVGLDFNVVNFVALPMSVGIGAVYGVHALHRMKELGDETLLSSSTGPALFLSGVTTLAGFLSLMSAQHRGMSGLGFVISVGVAVNLVVSLVLLPSLRRALRTRAKS